MDPFDITTVIYTKFGSIVAYNDNGKVISKLTESGLIRLKQIVGTNHLVVLDHRPPLFDPKAFGGGIWVDPVRAVATSPLNRMALPDKIDGARLEDGDLILLTAQKDPAWNGIHRVKMRPRGMVRCSMEPYEGAGLMTLVKDGDLYDSTCWMFDGTTWSQVTAAP